MCPESRRLKEGYQSKHGTAAELKWDPLYLWESRYCDVPTTQYSSIVTCIPSGTNLPWVSGTSGRAKRTFAERMANGHKDAQRLASDQ